MVQSAIKREQHGATCKGRALSLQFLGGDTGDGGSPRLYQEGDDFLVQGYTVVEPQLLAELQIPDGETVVRVPQSLWKYLPAGQRVNQRTEEGRREQMPVHREMRDLYAEEEEDAWRAEMSDHAEREAYRRDWLGLMSATAARLAAVKGDRVPGPDPGGMRFGEAPVLPGMAPAEQVRRLLRRGTSGPSLPVTDLTVIDGTTKLINHFSSDGTWVGSVMIDSSALARQSSWAFNAAWALSAPHGRRDPA
jgi:hypothetical protein